MVRCRAEVVGGGYGEEEQEQEQEKEEGERRSGVP